MLELKSHPWVGNAIAIMGYYYIMIVCFLRLIITMHLSVSQIALMHEVVQLFMFSRLKLLLVDQLINQLF